MIETENADIIREYLINLIHRGMGENLTDYDISEAVKGRVNSDVKKVVDELLIEVGKYIGKNDYVINSVVFDIPEGGKIAEGAAIDYVETYLVEEIRDMFLIELLKFREENDE